MTDMGSELSEESLDLSWRAFGARLADRLVELGPGGEVVIESLTGSPYVRLHRGDTDVAVERPETGEVVLVATVVDAGGAACALLREVYGVPHPALLGADGLQDPEGDEMACEPVFVPARLDDVVMPANDDELRAFVGATLAELLGEVEHDDEGDARCQAGQSVIFVRVLDNYSAIRVFAEIVVEPTHLERVSRELEWLNRTHPFARFTFEDGAVHLAHHLTARPYVAQHLRMALAFLLGEVDDLAAGVAQRLGGRRFLEEPAPEHEVPVRPSNPGYSDRTG